MSQKKILIIDDDSDITETMKIVLTLQNLTDPNHHAVMLILFKDCHRSILPILQLPSLWFLACPSGRAGTDQSKKFVTSSLKPTSGSVLHSPLKPLLHIAKSVR